MTGKTTRVRISRELADEAMRSLGVKSRTEAVRVAVKGVFGRERPQGPTEVLAERSKLRETKAKGR